MTNKLSGNGVRRSPGRGKNIWTTSQRETLSAIVSLHYSLDSSTLIFNRIFTAELHRCGLPSGLSKSSISAQLGERGKNPEAWNFMPTSQEKFARRRRIEEQIYQVAQALGIQPAQKPRPKTPTRPRSLPSTPALTPVQRIREKIREVQCVVFVPKAEQIAALEQYSLSGVLTQPRAPKTPSRRDKRRMEATEAYTIRFGTQILLTPAEKAETEKDLVWPDQPNPTQAGLLYRIWSKDSQSPLNEYGEFVAGMYKWMPVIPIPPPPTAANNAWAWPLFAAHMNRDPVQTPLISTSNNLMWILRQSIIRSRQGEMNNMITVINASQIDKDKLFHGKSIHDALKKKRCFTKAAFIYHGFHEFLVFGKVPKKAILKTVAVDQLFEFARNVPEMGALLRLEQIAVAGQGFPKRIFPRLKEDKIPLSTPTIRATANVIRYLGLNASSSIESLAHVCSDLVHFWALFMEKHTSAEWQEKAAIFASAMHGGDASDMRIIDFERLKFVFLFGVASGQGDPNWQLASVQKMRLMATRSLRIGLKPTEIICDPLRQNGFNAVVAVLTDFGNNLQRRLNPASPSQALLAEPDEKTEQILIGNVGTNIEDEERIIYNLDEEYDIVVDDEDDNDSIYEL